MLVRYSRLLPALAFVACAVVIATVGFAYYEAWHPWIMACGGAGNYCGGPFVPPNPYLAQDGFLVLVAFALVLACGSLIDWAQEAGSRGSQGLLRPGAAFVLAFVAAWLLAFVAFWRSGTWGALWTVSSREVIDAVFFASLVLVPAASALAGSVLSWDALRGLLRSPALQ